MRGFKDLAQEVLKLAIQRKSISNIGLGAVIACESVNEEQRDLCQWMADETDDPYLKALLAYFVYGDWKAVVDMPLLPLADRVGCALKYLDDSRLTHAIQYLTDDVVSTGDIEGVLLTGLADRRSFDLFQHYTAKSNDLPTAVLALSFACPVYLNDPRFGVWQESYLMQMQHWRLFRERMHYVSAHV